MKRKLKIEVKISLAVILFILIGFIFIRIKRNTNSFEYKLSKLGYSKNDISIIIKLEKEKIQDIIGLKYNEKLTDILKDKYFMYKNLNRYIDYANKNSNLNTRDVVEIVNVNRDRAYYKDIQDTDTKQGASMLVNKYYTLKDFQPVLVNVSLKYAYQGNKLVKEAGDAVAEMFIEAKKENYNLILNGSYRDYKTQAINYDNEKIMKDIHQADKVIARSGHSEHQTGLAFDINLYNKKFDNFENTEEYKWLLDNSYRYGFILRYPKDKENITGFTYEAWHFRYVGKTISEYIYKNNITFDEYYSYYIEK